MLTVDNDDTKLQSRNTTTTTRGGAENTYHGRSVTEIVSLVKAHYHARAFDDGVSRKRLWSLISMTVIFDPSSFASFEDGVCKNCLRFQKTILQKCHQFNILQHCQWTDVVSALLKHVFLVVISKFSIFNFQKHFSPNLIPSHLELQFYF